MTRTRQLEVAVTGLAMTIVVVSVILIATGDVATGGFGVVGAVALWWEVQHG